MSEITRTNKKTHKFQLEDLVRHTNNPDLIYIVQTIFADGSYRIIPMNADIGQAITFATEDCMTLYKKKEDWK